MNLAVNARDAMTDGGTLTIEATSSDEAVRLLVEDTGVGMSEETRSKAFDPFFTTKPGGTGLGLAVSREIVEMHGGRMWAESEGEGRGSTFVVELGRRMS